MDSSIKIIEKPAWVSWEDIKRCLYDAHAENRKKGINMTHYLWPADKIRDSLGEHGTIFLAMDGTSVVGTAAISERFGETWYARGRYAYICFDGVLPAYQGQGINKALSHMRDSWAREKGYDIFLLDTHWKNRKLQKIAGKQGYRHVHFFRSANKDHFNVVMVRWLSGCPYSKLYCKWKYGIRIIKTVLVSIVSDLKM